MYINFLLHAYLTTAKYFLHGVYYKTKLSLWRNGIMKINTNYNYKNNSLAFKGFKTASGGVPLDEITQSIFKSKEAAKLYEDITDEKGIDVWFFENHTGGAYSQKKTAGYEAIIVDPKPAKGQHSSKALSTNDEKSLSEKGEMQLKEVLVKKDPDITDEDVKKVILQARVNNFSDRLKDCILMCHSDLNIKLASRLKSMAASKGYDTKSLKEAQDKLTKYGISNESAVLAHQYNDV